MKKLITLVVAGCMVLGSLGTASAIDVKVKGQWWFHYGYYSNNTLTSKDDSGANADRVRARQRIRTQIQFVADENLSAMLNLESNMHWGARSNGGQLDSDVSNFVVKHAYLDWTIPNTQVKTRMGMQGLRFPWVAFGNPIMDADVAGITVSSQLTPELGLTVFWARPYDSNYYGANQQDGQNSMDDMDIFGFMLPIKTDIIRATPYAAFALIGRDSDYWPNGTATNPVSQYSAIGTVGYGNGWGRWVERTKGANNRIDSTAYGWWAGTTLELPILDPFFVKIDAMMGGLETGESDFDSFGYFVAADIGYKFSFGALSAIGWYSSGDKDEDDRGMMPIISHDGGFKPTRWGTAGTSARSFDDGITGNGIGMWGIGLQLANVSFVDNLSHTARVVYMGGTSEGDSRPRNTVKAAMGDGGFHDRLFLMSSDRAWEINLLNSY
ncbi:outer membrane homotrimeric porin, partial [Desulfovibrio sp. OttesenSCG-928-O18]|nr:outer membrane homotrimeric porin [Desulfovibrio sp. OttesenSCG-928-O18]